VEELKSANLENLMKYQLVLQWPASSIKDFDAVIEVESVLIDGLTADSEVDGHDAGSGETNIFIRTNDPIQAFDEIKSILGSRDFWVDTRVAYREVGKDDYIVLWPAGLANFRIV
jgi:hypothetical protein